MPWLVVPPIGLPKITAPPLRVFPYWFGPTTAEVARCSLIRQRDGSSNRGKVKSPLSEFLLRY